MILVQYGKNENKLGGWSASGYFDDKLADTSAGQFLGNNEGLKGYAIELGAVTPLFGGNLYTSVNFTDGETDGDVHYGYKTNFETDRVMTADLQRWGVAVGYDYPLSKRTKLYGFVAYNEGELDRTETKAGVETVNNKVEEQDTEVGVGLIHYF